MSPLIYATLGGLCWALLGLCYKMADHRGCRPIPYTFALLLAGALGGAVLLPFEHTTWNAPLLWIISAGVGLVTFIAVALLTRTNTLGPASITWTMLNLGLLIPILLAPILFHESLHLIDGMLILLFLLMLVFFARSMATAGETCVEHLPIFTISVIAIFLLEGAFLLGSKIKYLIFADNNTFGFAVITYSVGVLLAWLTHRINPQYTPLRKNEWFVGTLGGICGCAGNIFFLAAMKLQAVVAYPMVLGISLLGGVLLTMFLYKERFNVYKITGLSLGFIMLLLATLRDLIVK